MRSRYATRPPPTITPSSVPITPTTTPCTMKMLSTVPSVAPIALRMAISRFFSRTIMISVAITLKAATKMIVAMTSVSAIELGPVERVEGAAEALLDATRERERRVEIVHTQLDAGDVVAFVEEALGLEEVGVDEAGVVFLKARLKHADDPELARAGDAAFRVG